MNNQDFERLKALCEKEGFDISIDHPQCDTFIISVKDIWEGVEFVECIGVASNTEELIFGKIYPIKWNEKNYVKFYCFEDLFGKHLFKPSTEQAYIEQLKKDAFERFGEIKKGDRFDRSNIDKNWDNEWYVSVLDFNYDKGLDRLYIGNLAIYQKGKWATRVPERVNVSIYDVSHEVTISQKPKTTFIFSTKIDYDIDGAAEFLASQLEKYLNYENC